MSNATRSAMHRHPALSVGGHGAEGEQRSSRACRWAPRRWRTCCGRATSNTIRPIRTGPIATASCFPPGTARCCCTACCTSPATIFRSNDIKQFRQWGSKTPGHPERGHHAGRRDHDRPARPGIRQRGRHGDRPKRIWPRATTVPAHDDHRSSHLGDRQRRRSDGRRGVGGRVARRSSASSAS